MGVNFIIIQEPRSTLGIDEHRQILQDAADHGDDLYWNKEGHVRVIPNAAIKNAMAIYNDFRIGLDQVGGVMPAGVRELRWGETTPNEP